MRGEFPDNVSGPTAAPEILSGNSPRTPCKNQKSRNNVAIYHSSYGIFVVSYCGECCWNNIVYFGRLRLSVFVLSAFFNHCIEVK